MLTAKYAILIIIGKRLTLLVTCFNMLSLPLYMHVHRGERTAIDDISKILRLINRINSATAFNERENSLYLTPNSKSSPTCVVRVIVLTIKSVKEK